MDQDGDPATLQTEFRSTGIRIGGKLDTGRINPPDVDAGATAPAPNGQLRILTLCSLDRGGAAIGTQRRVSALRNRGVNAKILSLDVDAGRDDVIQYRPANADSAAGMTPSIWQQVVDKAIRPVRQSPGYRAEEMFCTGTMGEFSKNVP